MADTLEISGKNTISFASGQRWQLYGQARPRGMSDPFSRQEVEREIRKLPLEIRSHALQMGLSKITFPFNIEGSSGADMEDALHDLIETLEDGALHIATRGARGTKAQIKYKKDGASADSYKTIFYGEYDEAGARDVLGREQMSHKLVGAGLTLWCEPTWHPASTTNLVNAVTVYNHDDADSGHDNFVDIAAANIKGDVEAPLKLRVYTAPGNTAWDIIAVAKRTRGTPSSFIQAREAEDASSELNWADASDSYCSGGNKKSNNTSTSGWARWQLATPSDDLLGRFRLVARVYTDDKTNTKLRVRYRWSEGPWHYNEWKWPLGEDHWTYIDLGSIYLDRSLPSGVSIYSLEFDVMYEKDASDVISLDLIELLPEDEGIVELSNGYMLNGQTHWDATADFEYVGMEPTTALEYGAPLTLKGELRLTPGKAHRLYFVNHWPSGGSGVGRWVIEHEVANSSASVTIDYLPQYISPLE